MEFITIHYNLNFIGKYDTISRNTWLGTAAEDGKEVLA